MVRRIAITQREVENADYPDPRDALSQDWAVLMGELFPAAALLPVPNRLPDATGWLSEVSPDLIVLSGGNDWGSAPHRDNLEVDIVKQARSSGVPTLFTCRGFQVLLALCGTPLVTDLSGRTAECHVDRSHEVTLSVRAFNERAGGTERIEVNSFHNQGALAADLRRGGELVAFAATDHGVLEGCVHHSLPFLGIQWHPERPGGDRAFDAAIITELASSGAFWA